MGRYFNSQVRGGKDQIWGASMEKWNKEKAKEITSTGNGKRWMGKTSFQKRWPMGRLMVSLEGLAQYRRKDTSFSEMWRRWACMGMERKRRTQKMEEFRWSQVLISWFSNIEGKTCCSKKKWGDIQVGFWEGGGFGEYILWCPGSP